MIRRELKNVIYEYDFEKKQLNLLLPKRASGVQLWMTLSRVEMFSLARFILRVAQKSGQKKRKVK